jgi:26S proteasome regulatory subunit N1
MPQESDTSLYKPALDQIKDFIKTSTSSMTAVPKPLKFLRPHYESLEKAYASWPEGENKVGHGCIRAGKMRLTAVAILR